MGVFCEFCKVSCQKGVIFEGDICTVEDIKDIKIYFMSLKVTLLAPLIIREFKQIN